MKAIPTCAAMALALALTSTFGAAPAAPQAPAAAAPKPKAPGSLIEAEPKPDVFLLYTGDVIGYIDSCG